MIVKIKRQRDRDGQPYWQSFCYEGTSNTTVSALLDALNYTDDLFDMEGNPAPRIRWECSCMQKLCGACAMIINGTPALACNTFLSDLKGDEIVLEPLRKFPVVADLIVDRSIIEDNLKRAEIYLGEYEKSGSKEYEQQYSVAKCLKCGLCLEVCPNYKKGENFYGAMFANHVYLARSQSRDRKKVLKQKFSANFASGCSKSLACEKICPMGISTLSSMVSIK